ncbi:MAG: argininosuccinate synthase, partial [Dehalococcoidia bacterium]|nr:argininosuccinate synthase [Dehalococcoidia bacterium]
VRFDVGIRTLDPSLAIVAPTREEAMSREAEIEYLQQHGIAIAWEVKGSFSIDENIWGRSVEAGVLEDPWTSPPPDAYVWTTAPEDAPTEGVEVEIGFEKGFPTTIDGEALAPVALVERLNDLGGAHGVGRVDHIEDRLVGIKSREIYEAPAATILFAAHRALETMTLSKQQLKLKRELSAQYAELIYDGLWFSAHHQDLAAYTASTQRFVSGEARVRLHRGSVTVTGRRAESSLYDRALATYDREDAFDHGSAVGFIDIWGLQTRVQARQQLLDQLPQALRIAQPREETSQ